MSLTALNHPLQLPEIITVIGQHLDIPDLIRCLRVCSSWQASFLPFAWCSVSIQSAKPNPTVEALSRYRQHIKDLSCHDGVWQEYMSIFCPNLRQLSIHCTNDSAPVVIGQYKQLRSLRVHGTELAPSGFFILKPAGHLYNVSSLELYSVDIESTETANFWNMCLPLEKFATRDTSIEEPPPGLATFEHLQELEYGLRTNMSICHPNSS